MFCSLGLFSVEDLNAQTLDWESFTEKILADEEESQFWVNWYDELCALHENPININEATTEVLQQIPFLTPQQIEELEAYVYSYGPMQSLGELNLIKGLDYDTRRILKFFLYCGEKKEAHKLSGRNLLKYGKHELVTRTDVPFYALSEKYLGSDFYHNLRYKYRYGKQVEAGFTAEKDMGERGVDSYSFYVSVGNKGILKKLVVGDYRLNFGQGLVLNTDFRLGKNTVLSDYGTTGRGVKGHSSTRESNYFRGVASTICLHKFKLSAFLGYQGVDATLDKEGFISTLKDDGYHRTPQELAGKRSVNQFLAGGNVSYQDHSFHVGITTAYIYLDKPFKQNASGYRLYYPCGDRFWNTGLDYTFRSYAFSLMGEWALSGQGGWAVQHRAILRLSSQFQLTLLHRYYDKRYNALYGQSFSENSLVKNEHGLYMGLAYSPSKSLKFSSYVDLFRFPYLKYGVGKPNTQGLDFMAEVQYTHDKGFSLAVRYKNKSKQADYKEGDKKGIAYTMNQKLKVQADYTMGSFLKGKNVINLTQVNKGNLPPSRGYSVSQSLQYKCGFLPLQFTLSGIYFHTDDYDSRIYTYEQGLLYSFSIPSFYGKGYRISALLQYHIRKNLSLQCKYGLTHAIDKHTDRPLLNVQLRYIFPS